MAKNRFTIAKRDIVKYFDETPMKVFKYMEIASILKQNIEFWRLAKSTTVVRFIEQLKSTNKLRKYNYTFPNTNVSIFVWGDELSIYNIIAKINKDAYYSHYSALFLHNLTEQSPKAIYINVEQTPKPIYRNELHQKNIDMAFARKPRMTTNFTTYKDQRIFMINGKHTGQLGVIDMYLAYEIPIRVTNIERTLIDATVRPAYTGGVSQVLNAYKNAKEYVSINKLCSTLKKLDYIYPYHQAIGFYLSKSGVYKQNQIDLLKKFKIEKDFYLTHNMSEKDYSKEWKIYYPKGF
jgi:predicted transcriptional regulator of viral defense system